MRSQREEIVLRGYDAFNDGDFETALAGFHPGVVWEVLPWIPDVETYHGHAGVLRFWTSWKETIGDFRVDVEEIVEVEASLIARVKISGRGRESSAEIAAPSFWQAWSFEGDAIAHVGMYAELEQALAALGLDQT